ncbi:unnamed protein product [Didymodactylos carnosus]|uniref:Peptidase M14 domain-containing protein n=1 Tax=Didymodactylos carnosus TaxID=1234261 RepID=A0A814EV91_9BILA|nr:unnamed protein product [Didymodactylos carnosus]CAF0977253.1 unnamed protein product [Didymodactylos carnosus]CAF3651272.1 unnamed protein product [Didymodactylos carnosus]CAF3750082.1 unnamed protein product [Didymodactylos carnosus]
MMKYIVKLFIIFVTIFSVESIVPYNNHQLWRLNLSTNQQVAQILELKREAHKYNLDFWTETFRTHVPVDVRIPPNIQTEFAELMNDYKISYNITIKNIGPIIEKQFLSNRVENNDDFDYAKYHTITDIYAWIDQMVATYPDLATTFSVGKTFEKRDMKCLKISSTKMVKNLDGTIVNAPKKAIWWDGGIHAREWISPATVIYLAYTLLSNYSKDPTITHFVDQFDFYILPVFN